MGWGRLLGGGWGGGGGVIQHDCKIHRVHISTFDML